MRTQLRTRCVSPDSRFERTLNTHLRRVRHIFVGIEPIFLEVEYHFSIGKQSTVEVDRIFYFVLHFFASARRGSFVVHRGFYDLAYPRFDLRF